MSLVQRQAIEDPVYKPPDINPKFTARLPHIREDLAHKLIMLKPQLEQAGLALGELHDFVLFEIEKAELRISQHQWKSKVDMAQVAVDKKWLAELQAILTEHSNVRLDTSYRCIDDLLSRLDRVFGERRL